MANESLSTVNSEKIQSILDWLTENEKKEMFNLLKKENSNIEELETDNIVDIPQELKDFRDDWMRKFWVSVIDNNYRIIEAADKIPVNIEKDGDGSRIVSFKLWNKTYTILDPKLKNHTDDEYGEHIDWRSISDINEYYVKAWWMKWNDVRKWKNKKLKEYVNQKQWEWFHIANIDEIKKILHELKKKAKLVGQLDIKELWNISSPELREKMTNTERYEIAMLMYLTGVDWLYFLSAIDNNSSWSLGRSVLNCCDFKRSLHNSISNDWTYGKPLMIKVS